MVLVEEEGGRGTTPGFTRVSTQDTDGAVAATSFPRVVEAGVRDTVASATSTRALAGAGAGIHRAAMEEGSAEAEVVGAGQTLAAPATNHLRRRSWEAATCRSNQQGHPLSQTRSRGEALVVAQGAAPQPTPAMGSSQ